MRSLIVAEKYLDGSYNLHRINPLLIMIYQKGLVYPNCILQYPVHTRGSTGKSECICQLSEWSVDFHIVSGEHVLGFIIWFYTPERYS